MLRTKNPQVVYKGVDMFEDLNKIGKSDAGKSAVSFVIAVVVEAAIVIAMVIAPLIFFSVLPESELLTFLTVPAPPAPPPPPPPPPTPIKVQPKQVIISQGFVEPTAIPREIPPPIDDIPVVKTVASNLSNTGFSSGVIGPATTGLNLGDLQTKVVPPPPPPPPPPKEKVSGGVLAAKLIRKVEPVYPEIAKKTRLQGKVVLKVEIDEDGNVVSCTAISGPTLLKQVAVDAVKQWKYSPTLLSGEPVAVESTVDVNFNLN